jgi:hypothetical protein
MINALFLSRAIAVLRPGSEFTFYDNDYSSIKWIKLEGTPPTENEINIEVENQKYLFDTKKQRKLEQKQALLNRLGITEEEARLLLG